MAFLSSLFQNYVEDFLSEAMNRERNPESEKGETCPARNRLSARNAVMKGERAFEKVLAVVV